jgi:hypothetical protein
MKMTSYLMLYKKSTQNGLKAYIWPENAKLLGDDIGKMFHDNEMSNDFLVLIPKAQATKENNRQMGWHQAKKFLCSKIIN